MKLVLFSDLHLDAPFAGLGREVARKRREALCATLRNIVTLARAERADALLCAGDLYEQEAFTDETMAFVVRQFTEVEVPVYVAPGNHDPFVRSSLYRRARWPANVQIFPSERLEPVPLSAGITLWGGAHTREAGTGSFLDGFRAQGPGTHLALFHGSEQSSFLAQGEGKQPHASFSEADIPEAGLTHAFVGHYHRAKAGRYHTYAGNPCPLSFGEDPGRGAVVATLHADGKLDRAWHPVAAYAVHNARVRVTGCQDAQDVRDRITSRLAGLEGCARVILEGELPPSVSVRPADLERDCLGTLDALQVQTAVRAAYDLDELATEPTVRGQFVRDVRDADLPAAQERRVLVTGLRALEGRKDLDVASEADDAGPWEERPDDTESDDPTAVQVTAEPRSPVGVQRGLF